VALSCAVIVIVPPAPAQKVLCTKHQAYIQPLHSATQRNKKRERSQTTCLHNAWMIVPCWHLVPPSSVFLLGIVTTHQQVTKHKHTAHKTTQKNTHRVTHQDILILEELLESPPAATQPDMDVVAHVRLASFLLSCFASCHGVAKTCCRHAADWAVAGTLSGSPATITRPGAHDAFSMIVGARRRSELQGLS